MTPTIDDIQTWLGASLPGGYRLFLEEHADDLDASDLVLLYGRSSFVERNETYETKEFCPGFVTIGNDSGDMELILALENESVLMVDGGSMRPDDAEPITDDLAAWIADGCPIPCDEEPVYSYIKRVHVYLENKPASIRTLLLIKTHLGLDSSIAELKALVETVPCSVTDQLSYAQAIGRCAEVNDRDHCLGIRSGDDESVSLPMQRIE